MENKVVSVSIVWMGVIGLITTSTDAISTALELVIRDGVNPHIIDLRLRLDILYKEDICSFKQSIARVIKKN